MLHCMYTAWSDGKIRAFSPETGKLLYEIVDAHPKSVTAMATTADCTRIVSGGKEGQVRVWIVNPAYVHVQPSIYRALFGSNHS